MYSPKEWKKARDKVASGDGGSEQGTRGQVGRGGLEKERMASCSTTAGEKGSTRGEKILHVSIENVTLWTTFL